MLPRTLIINGNIYFRLSDSVMWSIHDEDNVVTVGVIPARMLDYLLSNAGRVISREELLGAVWTEYGLRPSGHSLNQNLSMLRKSLIHLGCDETIIRTLPRLGYLIEESMVTVREDADSIPTPSLRVTTVARKGGRHPFLTLAVACLCLLLMGSLVWFGWLGKKYNDRNGFEHLELYPLMTTNECPVYTINPVSARGKIARENIAKKMIDENTCGKDTFYILFVEDTVLMQNNKGRLFIARCNRMPDINSILSGCESVYERDYEKNI